MRRKEHDFNYMNGIKKPGPGERTHRGRAVLGSFF
jgi:hypothetical protein